MSHFVVVAFTESGEESEVERLLAPYDEQLEPYDEDRARWDWWVIGGRWDGRMRGLESIDDEQGGFNFGDAFHTLERNACPTLGIAEDFVPFAYVTPGGEWIEKGRMGWFAVVDGEKDQEDWTEQWNAARSEFADAIAVSVDCHV